MAGEEFGYNENGDFCHRQVGADTWIPFKKGNLVLLSKIEGNSSYTLTKDYAPKQLIIIYHAQIGHAFSEYILCNNAEFSFSSLILGRSQTGYNIMLYYLTDSFKKGDIFSNLVPSNGGSHCNLFAIE